MITLSQSLDSLRQAAAEIMDYYKGAVSINIDVSLNLIDTDSPSISGLLSTVAKAYGVSVADIRGKGRSRQYSDARILVYAVLQKHYKYHNDDIMTSLFARERSTGYHYADAHEGLLRTEKKYRELYERIIQEPVELFV